MYNFGKFTDVITRITRFLRQLLHLWNLYVRGRKGKEAEAPVTHSSLKGYANKRYFPSVIVEGFSILSTILQSLFFSCSVLKNDDEILSHMMRFALARVTYRKEMKITNCSHIQATLSTTGFMQTLFASS